MAVPDPRTWESGELVTAPLLNSELRDPLNFILSPPRCHAYRSSGGSHSSSGNWQVIGLNAELYDSGAIHDPVIDASRLVAPEPGLYRGTGQVGFRLSAAGLRGARIRKNAAGTDASGTLVAQVTAASHGVFGWRGLVPFAVQLNAGDHIELFAYQSSGANLSYVVGAGETYLNLLWVSRL
jgi:hypothetical protein